MKVWKSEAQHRIFIELSLRPNAGARSYDLVLMDINMPVLDGLGATAAIRAWEGEQGVNLTPIVTVTGRASANDRRRSTEVGCNGHLAKPLPRQVLLDAIARFTQAG